tara:strand:+ start:616 stop:1356 length:741 start_codon:yes stop_codon:yes gene_type:complete
VNLGKAGLISFLTGFGPGVGDLRLKAGQMSLSGTVALPTHMLHTKISATVDDAGEIVIADLPKLLTFLKTLPQDALVTLWQPKNSALRVISGKTELNLPTTDYVASHKNVAKAMAMVSDAENSHWKSWAGKALNCYGKIKVADLIQLKSVDKVVGKETPVIMTFSPDNEHVEFSAGNKGGAKMTVCVDMEDCDGEKAQSHYGPWLPQVLHIIPSGTVELYTADDFICIFRHTEKDHLLLVMDKRGE